MALQEAAGINGYLDEGTPQTRPAFFGKVKIMKSGRTGQTVPRTSREETPSPAGIADIVVFALILSIGVMQFFLYQHASEYFYDDVFVADCARSLVQHGFYGIAGRPETNQPPGTAAILALVCFLGGCSRAAFLRTMVVFETLGFVACYELLRRHIPRAAAAAICLALISSPIYFSLATQWLQPCFPYFFATMSTFLVVRKFEEAKGKLASTGWGLLLGALIAGSMMVATAGIALLGAIVLSLATGFFQDRQFAFARLKKFVAVLLLGIAVQGLWMSRKPAPMEWPLPGYPKPYLEQLKVKNGNDPEQGLIRPRDIPLRVGKNVYEHSHLLGQSLIRLWINPGWPSVVILGPVVLILLGWGYSLWQTGGRGLLEWYFAGYEFIYLLWPWNMESRFFLPVAPLACLYIWRGGHALAFLWKNKPRLLGAMCLPVSASLATCAWFWISGSWIGKQMPRAGVQGKLSFATWLLSAIVAGWMIVAGPFWQSLFATLSGWWRREMGFLRTSPMRIAQVVGALAVLSQIAPGLEEQLQIGRNNRNPGFLASLVPPDVKAGQWIGSHTEADAVVMARYLPTVYHYSQRRMVWFPPSSDAKLLMEGILRLKVNYVVVVKRENNYYLPADTDCFAKLNAAYPEAFHLVTRAPDFSVFQVLATSTPQRGG
jgi:hypothetical protein